MNYYEKAIERLGWQEITLWYLCGKNWQFNHIEDGHVKQDKPIGDARQTRVWANQKWSKQFVYAVRDSKPLRFVL